MHFFRNLVWIIFAEKIIIAIKIAFLRSYLIWYNDTNTRKLLCIIHFSCCLSIRSFALVSEYSVFLKLKMNFWCGYPESTCLCRCKRIKVIRHYQKITYVSSSLSKFIINFIEEFLKTIKNKLILIIYTMLISYNSILFF